jgi:hypothetical protein
MTSAPESDNRSLALRYTGDRANLETAEAELFAAVSQDALIRKTAGLFEFAISDKEARSLVLPEGWLVYEYTYAEINPPGVTLTGLQKRLEELRRRHG